jgi:phospholipid/cholesterol/gamma-HCH transport system permease protein
VTALLGFLIGVVMSYLSALQLRALGADTFIVNILGLGIIRELGPVLVSVLVAGRSGSAMTAQLGVMRVTEEIDALTTMGVSRYVRLVLPKVVALTLAMPLLTLWGSSVAIFGGMVSAYVQLDMSFDYFLNALPRAVPVANLVIGLVKGAVFGLLIALVACHFGLRVKPNTESLSANTTASVVTSITVVILVDAVFAIVTRTIGLPYR